MKKEELPGNPEFPPEGEGAGWRYESADLDIEKLQEYLRKEIFSDEGSIEELLTQRYHLTRKNSISAIDLGMTLSIDITPLKEKLSGGEEISEEELDKRLHTYRAALIKGKKKITIKGRDIEIKKEDDVLINPVSGIKPQAVARLTLKTKDGTEFDLRIFQVFNRNNKFRYEYILKNAGEFREDKNR